MIRDRRGRLPTAVAFRGALPRQMAGAEVLLIVVVALWSLNFPLLKYALDSGFDPLVFAGLRWIGAALALTCITLAVERSIGVRRKHVVRLAVVIGGIFALNQVSFVYSMTAAPASTIAVLFGLFPVFVALTGRLTGTRLRRRQWYAVALSSLGAALVAVGAGGGSGTGPLAVGLGLANALLFAVFVALVAPVLRAYSAFRINAVLSLACAALLAVIGLQHVLDGGWAPHELAAWLALGYMMLSIVLGNVLWLRAVDAVGPNKASVYANLQPFVGAALAFALLSESVTVVQLVGGMAIFLSMVLAQSSRPEKSLAPAS
jgi:drug/metabolite transporter (DMT)-like permease